MGQLKDIYWISSPLGYEKRIGWSEKAEKYAPAFAKAVDPRTEWRWLDRVKHWTLEVDGKCYELWSKGHKNIFETKLTTDLCQPQCITSKKWKELRDEGGIEPEKKKVGQTRLSHKKIDAKGMS